MLHTQVLWFMVTILSLLVLHIFTASIFTFKDNPLDKLKLLYVPLLSFFITFAIMLWGVIFICADRDVFTWRTDLLPLLLLLNIPVAIVLLIFAKGIRWFTFSVVLLQGFVSVVALFIALLLTTCDAGRL